MRTRAKWFGVGGLALAVVVAAFVARGSVRTQASSNLSLPMSVRGLVCAQAFKLDAPYVNAWRAERSPVQCGWLLVLAVDPTLARMRNELEPVLYVGNEIAERTNPGDLAGRRLVIVPSAPDEDGWPLFDPLGEPMWFGDPALPERLDALAIRAARLRAEQVGIAPFAHGAITGAIDCGNGRVSFADRSELQRHAALLILQHAPQESAFANGLLAAPVY